MNTLVNSVVEKQRKEAWETFVSCIFPGRLTTIQKNKNNFWRFNTVNVYLTIYLSRVLLVRWLIISDKWWFRDPGSFHLDFMTLQGPFIVFSIGSSEPGRTNEGQEWRIVLGSILWPSLPSTFHWPELVNMTIPNFKGGWETWSINTPSRER